MRSQLRPAKSHSCISTKRYSVLYPPVFAGADEDEAIKQLLYDFIYLAVSEVLVTVVQLAEEFSTPLPELVEQALLYAEAWMQC